MKVTPRATRDAISGLVAITCICGSQMQPEIGRVFETGVWWFWWRCSERSDHISESLPLPRRGV